MGVYLANMIMPKNCIECDYSESNGKTYTWCMIMGIHTDGLERVPNNCPLIEIDLVTCKECKHRDPEDKKCDCGMFERQRCIFPVSDDYFCKYGERKE